MKSSQYVQRVLREQPTHTKGGVPVQIAADGSTVRTLRNGARNGSHSVYVPCDYPQLFGWDRVGRHKTIPPRLLDHKGFTYIRLPKI